MMAHELLRQAALILAQGWSKGSDARDDTGRMVPLYIGASRANIARGGGISAFSGMSDLLSGRRPDSLNVGHFPGAKP